MMTVGETDDDSWRDGLCQLERRMMTVGETDDDSWRDG